MNTPEAPAPKTFHAVSVVQDDAGQQVIVKTPIDGATGFPIVGATPRYAAQAVAQLSEQTPQGMRQVQHPFQFDIPDAVNLADAFARIPLCAERGLEAELHRLKIAAMRQGATLQEMPQRAGKRG